MKRVIALFCVIGLFLAALPVFAAEPIDPLEEALLGTVSQRYESNGDPGTVSSGNGDLGGASYGAYQFAGNAKVPHTFAKWCVSSGENPTIGNRLIAAYEKDGSTFGQAFKTEWQAIAKENKDEFYRLQKRYVKEKYYLPAVEALYKYFDLDIDLYGIAFKNAVWSRTVQHGLGSYDNRTGFLGILRRVEEALPEGLFNATSEVELITAIYEESGAVVDSGTNPMTAKDENGNDRSNAAIIREYGLEGKYMKYFSGNSANVQAGVYLRLRVNEIRDLLGMIVQYGGYGGLANFGVVTPSLQQPYLLLTDADGTEGFYTDKNTMASAEMMDEKSTVVYCPQNYAFVDELTVETIGGHIQLPFVWDASGYNQIELSLCFECPQQESALLQVKLKDANLQYSLGGFSAGWHKIVLAIPDVSSLTTESVGLVFESFMGAVAIDSVTAVMEFNAAQTAKINTETDNLNCRTKPSAEGELLGQFKKDSKVLLLGHGENGWFMCYGTNTQGQPMMGWCSGDYLSERVALSLPNGDVTGNGKTEADDALWILQSVVGKRKFTEEQVTVADLNLNGTADSSDALRILQIVVGKA